MSGWLYPRILDSRAIADLEAFAPRYAWTGSVWLTFWRRKTTAVRINKITTMDAIRLTTSRIIRVSLQSSFGVEQLSEPVTGQVGTQGHQEDGDRRHDR